MNKKSVRLYIEGGSVGRQADHDFRRAWKKFLQRELEQHARTHGFATIEVVRGTGRSQAFSDFVASPQKHPDDLCVLLVDSETPVPNGKGVWAIVKERVGDGWDKPDWASDRHLYLMVIAVEAWLLTDHKALKDHFKKNFDVDKLPTTNLETRTKNEMDAALKKASRLCKSGPYRHGMAHEIMEYMDSNNVKTLPHGARLFSDLRALIAAQQQGGSN